MLKKDFYRDKKNIKSHIASLKPSKSSIWDIDPRMVYRVYTNKNGFRTKDELKSDANIVIVYGDSFTFGPYLANHDTYPELANFLAVQPPVPSPTPVIIHTGLLFIKFLSIKYHMVY